MAYRTKICDQGGIFNAGRPSKYSAETSAFLKDLIKESRLTTLQRKSLQGCLRSGGSSPSTAAVAPKSRKPSAEPVKRYRSSKPRTLKDIVESGAYQPEVYRPSNRRQKNYDGEKEKLQSIMAFGTVIKSDVVVKTKKPVDPQKATKECTDEELIDTAISEIEDREKFLLDMDLLGQFSKYSGWITHEIRDRIKKLEVFVSKTACSHRATDIRDITNRYRKSPGTPKPLPTTLPIV